MTSNDQYRRTLWPALRVAICLVLAGIVSYNPFVGLIHAGLNTHCDRLASNRSTVGSSELQHFSPASDATQQPDANVDDNRNETLKPVEEDHLGEIQPEAAVMHQEVLAGVWFRPPPLQ